MIIPSKYHTVSAASTSQLRQYTLTAPAATPFTCATSAVTTPKFMKSASNTTFLASPRNSNPRVVEVQPFLRFSAQDKDFMDAFESIFVQLKQNLSSTKHELVTKILRTVTSILQKHVHFLQVGKLSSVTEKKHTHSEYSIRKAAKGMGTFNRPLQIFDQPRSQTSLPESFSFLKAVVEAAKSFSNSRVGS